MEKFKNYLDIITQGIQVLGGITDDVYMHATLEFLGPRGAVGVQWRHIIDFYNNFIEGVKSGNLDYTYRKRDSLIESDRELGIQKGWEIYERISKLDYEINQQIRVRDEFGLHNSSLSRELSFVSSHAIHHYATMGTILKQRGISLPERFGLNPSTPYKINEKA